MGKEKMLLNELPDEELDEIAGGGTYTRDGYLKTTGGYSCQYFKCKACGQEGEHQHSANDGTGRSIYTVKLCRQCTWHSTLRCNNPANKK